MNLNNIISRLATLTLLSISTASSWALPLTFEFTGTISDTVLVSRSYQPTFAGQPEWKGQIVTGMLTIDLSQLSASAYNTPGNTQYGTGEHPQGAADWMSFTITNPDGSILDISNSIPIYPEPEDLANDAFTYIEHQSYWQNGSSFYAHRSYDAWPYPRNDAALVLRADGDNADWLTSSVDYNDVIIKPEFANVDNWGFVYQLNDLGVGYEYYFSIDSLARVKTEVPEPNPILLLGLGLFAIGFLRNRKTQKLN